MNETVLRRGEKGWGVGGGLDWCVDEGVGRAGKADRRAVSLSGDLLQHQAAGGY